MAFFNTSELPVSLYRAAQVRALDQIAVRDFNIPSISLMHRAGRAADKLVRSLDICCKNVIVFCGSGNNGGDGLVLASCLHERGVEVRVLCLKSPENLRGDAARAYRHAADLGVSVTLYRGEPLVGVDLLVDALLGTGFQGVLSTGFAAVINLLNEVDVPVLALDLPSGLNADTGAVAEDAVCARWTISFGALKPGLFTGAGPEYTGTLYLDDLQIPAAALADLPVAAGRMLVGKNLFLPPRRPRHMHKGDCGHLLVIGGNCGMAGAVLLAAQAALRCGAGLVSVATHPDHAGLLVSRRPELMIHGISSGPDIDQLLAHASALVVGPGLGRDAWAQQMLQQAIACGLPTVFDADALHLLHMRNMGKLDLRHILTPHPGEAAAMLGCSSAEIQADRFAAIEELWRSHGATVILKGAGTLVFAGEELSVCDCGNPGMASGGMGDLLSGVVGSLLAQKFSAPLAARLGTWLHSAAADHAAELDGERGMIASDLLPWLRRLLNSEQINSEQKILREKLG